jgi:hypothetical protein
VNPTASIAGPQVTGRTSALNSPAIYINLEAQEESAQEPAKETQQLFNVTLVQGGELPNNRVYLDGCSTVTAFKNNKFLKSIKTEVRGVKINCNVGAISTNKRGQYGNLKA